MAVEIPSGARRMYFRPISWSAVIAGLAVGVALQLLLLLAGVAVGGLVVEPGSNTAQQMSASAAIWSGVSMLIAAFVGGYVASRSSGLRRKGDGVLHGVVSWAASTLLTKCMRSSSRPYGRSASQAMCGPRSLPPMPILTMSRIRLPE